jgi:hypothetical protein
VKLSSSPAVVLPPVDTKMVPLGATRTPVGRLSAASSSSRALVVGL